MVVGKGSYVSPLCLSVGAFPVCRKPRGLTLSPWDRVLQIKAHQYQVTGCCLSPDRRLLATVCLGGCLKVMPGSVNTESAHEVVLSAWQRLPATRPEEALPVESRGLVKMVPGAPGLRSSGICFQHPTLPLLSPPAVGHSPWAAGLPAHLSQAPKLHCFPPRRAGNSHRQLGWQHQLLPGGRAQSHQGEKGPCSPGGGARKVGWKVGADRRPHFVSPWACVESRP